MGTPDDLCRVEGALFGLVEEVPIEFRLAVAGDLHARLEGMVECDVLRSVRVSRLPRVSRAHVRVGGSPR